MHEIAFTCALGGALQSQRSYLPLMCHSCRGCPALVTFVEHVSIEKLETVFLQLCQALATLTAHDTRVLVGTCSQALRSNIYRNVPDVTLWSSFKLSDSTASHALSSTSHTLHW